MLNYLTKQLLILVQFTLEIPPTDSNVGGRKYAVWSLSEEGIKGGHDISHLIGSNHDSDSSSNTMETIIDQETITTNEQMLSDNETSSVKDDELKEEEEEEDVTQNKSDEEEEPDEQEEPEERPTTTTKSAYQGRSKVPPEQRFCSVCKRAGKVHASHPDSMMVYFKCKVCIFLIN